LERASWATVVAKVPVREQLRLYDDAFLNAKGYERAHDFPHYIGYVVQRAEVEPGKPLNWKTVPVYDGQRKSLSAEKLPQGMTDKVMQNLLSEAVKSWAGNGPMPEVVDPRYTDGGYVLTFPLPPLVGRN